MLAVVEEWSERQKAVLDAALSLLVEAGDRMTMAAVARRAACSKETLYKWFGDRDGLLTAAVRHQAARVRPVALGDEPLGREAFEAHLGRFARDWLTVISGEVSVALNRVAIGQAAGASEALGRIVLQNGPIAMGHRLAPVLDAGQAAGHVRFPDQDAAFRTFFGLVMRDLQIRLLLGEDQRVNETSIDAQASLAARQFLILFGVDPNGGRDAADNKPKGK